MDIGTDSGTLSVLIGLFVFGAAYNVLVAWMERRGYSEGYVSLLVVGGVLVTLGAVSVLDVEAAALVLAAFAASGTPMVLGSIARHMRARERSQRAIQREVIR